MLLALIRKEILSHVLSLRFALTFLLILVLGFISFALGAQESAAARDEFAARQKSYRATLDTIAREQDQEKRFERIFWDEGRSEPVPAPPLSAVVQGMTPEMPAAVSVSAGGWRNIDRSGSRNPLMGLFRTPDFAYVVSVILSLLAILFVFDSVSGEKEEGTLRLMLCNAVPRHTVLVAKWIGGLAALLAPLALVFVGGVGYAWAKGAFDLSSENLTRVGLIAALAGLYVSLFFSLGLFISCATHRSTTSLFVSLLVWVAWVLALPNLAPVAAKIIAPAPSAREIDAEKRAVDQEIQLRMQRLRLFSGELGYGEKIKQGEEKLRQEGRDRKRRWDQYLEEANRRQGRWAGVLGRLSPSGSWVYAATELAGTGTRLREGLEESRRRMQEAMRNKADELWKAYRASDHTEMPEIRLDTLPTLRLQPPGLQQSVDESLNDLLLLAILNVLFFMLAFAMFLRYDVR